MVRKVCRTVGRRLYIGCVHSPPKQWHLHLAQLHGPRQIQGSGLLHLADLAGHERRELGRSIAAGLQQGRFRVYALYGWHTKFSFVEKCYTVPRLSLGIFVLHHVY